MCTAGLFGSSKQPRGLFFFLRGTLAEAPDLASPRSAIISRGARGSSIVEIATSTPNICFTRPVISRHCSNEHKSWRNTSRWRIFSARSSATFNISRCYRDRVDRYRWLDEKWTNVWVIDRGYDLSPDASIGKDDDRSRMSKPAGLKRCGSLSSGNVSSRTGRTSAIGRRTKNTEFAVRRKSIVL